jgi:hypothetical protein
MQTYFFIGFCPKCNYPFPGPRLFHEKFDRRNTSAEVTQREALPTRLLWDNPCFRRQLHMFISLLHNCTIENP